VNQAVVAQIMGHTPLRTTARYVNHNAEHHRKAVGAISGRISKIANGGNTTGDPEERAALIVVAIWLLPLII